MDNNMNSWSGKEPGNWTCAEVMNWIYSRFVLRRFWQLMKLASRGKIRAASRCGATAPWW